VEIYDGIDGYLFKHKIYVGKLEKRSENFLFSQQIVLEMCEGYRTISSFIF
jgi:hypothetical protein